MFQAPSTGVRTKKRKSNDPTPQNSLESDFQRTPFNPEKISLMEPSYPVVDRDSWEDYDYVERYITEDLLKLIVEKTNQTYVFKHGKSMNLTLNELKVWIGINFVMSALKYPKIRMYWENKWQVPLIADAMTRDRFFAIRTNMKVVFDNDISKEDRQKDRLWKIRNLLDHVHAICNTEEKDQELSLDEMMIPFSGQCSMKQFVPNKPNPVGLKAWVLSNPSGIVLDFIIYQGSETFSGSSYLEMGLGATAVLTLAEPLVPGHVLYHDRYFSSLKLCNALLKRGIRSSGTIMSNRIPKTVLLKTDKELKKEGRGSVDFVSDGKVCFIKWFDNKAVYMISSNESIGQGNTVKRWCKKNGRYVQVKQPDVIKSYNKNMGGVDMADRMLSYCSSRGRTNKWTVRVILHMLDLCVSNGWLLYRQDKMLKNVPNKLIRQMRCFKLDYGESLITIYSSIDDFESDSDPDEDYEPSNPPSPKGKRSKTQPLPSKEQRKRGQHCPVFDTKQHRCRNQKCGMKTFLKCLKCNVYLCLLPSRNCYRAFHS